MRNRFALRAGSLTDNFQIADLKYGLGLKLLELLTSKKNARFIKKMMGFIK